MCSWSAGGQAGPAAGYLLSRVRVPFLDLSQANLPPGSWLTVGTAVLEVSAEPHRGCKKFAARYGVDAPRLVNSKLGDSLRLRGVNARVVRPGIVCVGDPIRRKLPTTATRRYPRHNV